MLLFCVRRWILDHISLRQSSRNISQKTNIPNFEHPMKHHLIHYLKNGKKMHDNVDKEEISQRSNQRPTGERPTAQIHYACQKTKHQWFP